MHQGTVFKSFLREWILEKFEKKIPLEAEKNSLGLHLLTLFSLQYLNIF